MEQNKKEQFYIDAFNKLKTASNIDDYQEIIRLLEQCEGMMDSKDLVLQCREEIVTLQLEETYQLAVSLSKKRDSSSLDQSIELLSSLGDYKDSKSLLEQVRQKKEMASHIPQSFPKKKHSKNLIIGIAALVIVGVFLAVLLLHRGNDASPPDPPPEISSQELGTLVTDRFLEASDLNWNVILGQTKLDKQDIITDDTRPNGKKQLINVPQANTVEDFVKYCRQYFSAEAVEDLLDNYDFVERDEKLYMTYSPGIGDPMLSETRLSAQKLSDTEYMITITEISIYNDSYVVERHLLWDEGNWVWDDTLDDCPAGLEVTYSD